MNDKVKLVIKVVVLVFIVGILIVKFTWPSADGPASVPSDTVPGPVASSADASNLVCVPEANTTPQEKAQNAPQETSKNTLQGNNDSRQATNSGEKQDQPSTNATQKQPTWMLFRSTTCIPCVEMQKTFDLLKPEFKNKVQFIAIDVNDPANAEILKAFKIRYIPTTYLFDKNEKLFYQQIGVVPVEEMRSKLKASMEVP